MARLAQVYIRLQPYAIDNDGLNRLGDITSEIASQAAGRHYTRPVDINVALDEGTLKTVLTITGSILIGAYTTVAEYKNFREGVNLLCEQAHDWGANVCGGFTDASQAKPNQITRREIRYKTPGELRQFFDELELVRQSRESQGGKEQEQAKKALHHAVRRWSVIQRDLSAYEVDLLKDVLNFQGFLWLLEPPKPRVREFGNEETVARRVDIREQLNQPSIGRRQVVSKPGRLSYRNTVHVDYTAK